VGSLVSVGVVGSLVGVVGVELVVGAGLVVGGLEGVDGGRDGSTDVPAALDGAVLPGAGVLVVAMDDEAGGEPADRSAGVSAVVDVAQPSAMSLWVPDAVELAAAELVGVPTDALVARSADTSGAVEITTAVSTAAPRTALPPATVHQSRRGERRAACRGLIGGLPDRPVHSGTPRPPVAPRIDQLESYNLVISAS
jgi:hypothetical protein